VNHEEAIKARRMKVLRPIEELKRARESLGEPAALNEALVATGIDALFALLDGDDVEFDGQEHRLAPADALVIERDEDGKWPEWARVALARCIAIIEYNPPAPHFVVPRLLDALAAAQEQNDE